MVPVEFLELLMLWLPFKGDNIRNIRSFGSGISGKLWFNIICFVFDVCFKTKE